MGNDWLTDELMQRAAKLIQDIDGIASQGSIYVVSRALYEERKRGREEARGTMIAVHDILRADDRYGALAHLPAGGIECEQMVEQAVDLLAAAIRSGQ